MNFDGQHDDETVLFFFRQHPVVLRKPLIAFLAILVIGMTPFSFNPINGWFQLGVLAGLIVGLLVFMYFWISWYFSVYIVTDQRIIQDTQNGLFGKQVVQVDLSKIQNINYEVPGFQASIFKFGTIVVQTFVGDLVIEKVHHPADIQKQITQILNELENES